MKKGFTLVEIMIVVAIIALLAALVLPGLLRARINANEAAAQANLKTIATACESYASANNGMYPTSWGDLLNGTAPYLNKNLSGTHQGYNINCTFTNTSYTCTAKPVSSTTGTKNFTIKTGGNLTSS
ncbi:MAG: hypothetical protein B6D56_00970 [Candidatus Omnitrophica bacterium 4484_70.1]|nr:MAG: hypothetical protein B6D56_00970 [Candidatus Omnitrophica bacterium 4484_70.1]